MKINAVFIPKIKFNKGKTLTSDGYKKYFLTAYLSLAVVVGIVIFTLSKEATSEYLTVRFVSFLNCVQNSGKAEIIRHILMGIFPYIGLVVLFSFSAIGDILIYLLSFIKFSGIGICISFLYTEYGVEGIKYCFTVFLPGKYLLIIANLMLIGVCINISRNYRQKNRFTAQNIKEYGVKSGFIVLLIILSVCVDLFTVSTLLPLTGINSFFR